MCKLASRGIIKVSNVLHSLSVSCRTFKTHYTIHRKSFAVRRSVVALRVRRSRAPARDRPGVVSVAPASNRTCIHPLLAHLGASHERRC